MVESGLFLRWFLVVLGGVEMVVESVFAVVFEGFGSGKDGGPHTTTGDLGQVASKN